MGQQGDPAPLPAAGRVSNLRANCLVPAEGSPQMSESTAGVPTPPTDDDLEGHLIRVSGDDGSESALPSGAGGDNDADDNSGSG